MNNTPKNVEIQNSNKIFLKSCLFSNSVKSSIFNKCILEIFLDFRTFTFENAGSKSKINVKYVKCD